jgi:hypothetical protein
VRGFKGAGPKAGVSSPSASSAAALLHAKVGASGGEAIAGPGAPVGTREAARAGMELGSGSETRPSPSPGDETWQVVRAPDAARSDSAEIAAAEASAPPSPAGETATSGEEGGAAALVAGRGPHQTVGSFRGVCPKEKAEEVGETDAAAPPTGVLGRTNDTTRPSPRPPRPPR